MKYRIKESEELVTRWKGGLLASESIEKVYQIEYRIAGFWGRLWGWEEIGSQFFTEKEAKVLLASERFADDDNTLWAIQNRIQEKLINGFAGRRKYSALKDPNKTAVINERLANLSMEFAN